MYWPFYNPVVWEVWASGLAHKGLERVRLRCSLSVHLWTEGWFGMVTFQLWLWYEVDMPNSIKVIILTPTFGFSLLVCTLNAQHPDWTRHQKDKCLKLMELILVSSYTFANA